MSMKDKNQLIDILRSSMTKEEHDTIQSKLLPCPHCGAIASGDEKTKVKVFFGGQPSIPHNHKIMCYGCNASMEQSSVEGVIAMWNQRMPANIGK